MLMLSPRLQAVADRVGGPRHADIGCDHGLLPLALCARLELVIAVEKHRGPFETARRALAGSPVDLRLGDGLDPLEAGEVDSLSVCGMGSLNIRDLLQRGREKLPPQLVLQPQDNALPVRHWARGAGFHVSEECWIEGHVVLHLRAGRGPDPAYAGLPVEAEFFGPLLLGNREYLEGQKRWLEGLGRSDSRLEFLRRVLDSGQGHSRSASSSPAWQPKKNISPISTD